MCCLFPGDRKLKSLCYGVLCCDCRVHFWRSEINLRLAVFRKADWSGGVRRELMNRSRRKPEKPSSKQCDRNSSRRGVTEYTVQHERQPAEQLILSSALLPMLIKAWRGFASAGYFQCS